MKAIIAINFLLLFNSSVFSQVRNLECGKDNRIKSNIPEIGRLFSSSIGGVCTITMISERCAITAGHCIRGVKYNQYVEFEVPSSKLSSENPYERAIPQESLRKNKYFIDRSFLKFENTRSGNDWAVFRLKKNSETQLYPGEQQGFLNYSFIEPKIGSFLRVSGYGGESIKPQNDWTQQTSTGIVLGFKN